MYIWDVANKMDFPKRLFILTAKEVDSLAIGNRADNLPSINVKRIAPSSLDKTKLEAWSLTGTKYTFEMDRNITESKVGMLKPEKWDATSLGFVCHLEKEKIMDIVVEMQEASTGKDKITLDQVLRKFDPLAYHSIIVTDLAE